MRSYVRYAAVACAASMLVLAGCGSEPAAPASPNLAEGSLTYAITPAQLQWTRVPDGPMPTDSLITLISGLIAVGGYPQFGTIQYSGGPSAGQPSTGAGSYGDWLDMSKTPNLSRSPLGWRFVFKLKPNAANFPIGRYVATIPVTVGGASNNPQSIVVVFNHCDNCLYVGDERLESLSVTDLIWDNNGDFELGHVDSDPGESYRFDDWRVFVPPFTTVQVDMIGECDASRPDVNLDDAWLTAWTTPTSIGQNDYDSDDDAGACHNSILYLTNSGPTQIEYLVRATTCCGTPTGPYRIVVSLFGGGGYTLRSWEPGDLPVEEKRANYRAGRSSP